MTGTPALATTALYTMTLIGELILGILVPTDRRQKATLTSKMDVKVCFFLNVVLRYWISSYSKNRKKDDILTSLVLCCFLGRIRSCFVFFIFYFYFYLFNGNVGNE